MGLLSNFSHSQSLVKVHLVKSLKLNNAVIYISIMNLTNENIYLYEGGSIIENGLINFNSPSNITFTAYNNQGVILMSSERRPLSIPNNQRKLLLELLPNTPYMTYVFLYDCPGIYGLFNQTISSLGSIKAKIHLLYKTKSMTEYIETEIESDSILF